MKLSDSQFHDSDPGTVSYIGYPDVGVSPQGNEFDFKEYNCQPTKDNDNGCCNRCFNCLGAVPCPTLGAWVLLAVSTSATAAALMIGADRTKTLLEPFHSDIENTFYHWDIVCLSILFGMVLFGSLFLLVATFSSQPAVDKFCNTSGKVTCVTVLNIVFMTVMFLYQIVWIVLSCVIAVPCLFMALLHFLYKQQGVACIDLHAYAITNLSEEICGLDLDKFYNKCIEVFLCYVIAYGGSILTALCMTYFLLFSCANVVRLQREASGPRISMFRNDVQSSHDSIIDTRM